MRRSGGRLRALDQPRVGTPQNVSVREGLHAARTTLNVMRPDAGEDGGGAVHDTGEANALLTRASQMSRPSGSCCSSSSVSAGRDGES